MTSPDQAKPTNAYIGTSGSQKVSGVQSESEAQIRAAGRAEADQAMGSARGNMITNLFGGLIGGIAQFISTFFSGVFGGGGGGLIDLIGGFLGVKNKVNDVADVQIPRLDNKIDNLDLGGGATAQRAFFGSPGTWIKPEGMTRFVIDAIGPGCGGRRYSGSAGAYEGGFVGGWSRVELLGSEMPSTVTVNPGAAGAGATSDGGLGSPGTPTEVVGVISAGSGTPDGPGYGNRTDELPSLQTMRGGRGGRTISGGGTVVSTSGSNGSFSQGGAGGSPTGSGADGGSGLPPNPSTLIGIGSCGGGGANKSGTGSGGRGGDGGFPGGGGGTGGGFATFGFTGNGGNGANGAVWITSYPS